MQTLNILSMFSLKFHISTYEDLVAAHLTKILNSDQQFVPIFSETVGNRLLDR